MKEVLPKIYLSGSFSLKKGKEEEWIRRTGTQYKCYSYAFVGEDAFFYCEQLKDMLDVDIRMDVGIMIDSGAFSFHRFMHKQKMTKSGKELRIELVDKLRDETIEKYVEFIKRRGNEFDFYVNFDIVKDAKIVYRMQKKLEKMGIKPMPMIHGDSGIEWLERYLEEGYNYIGIGSSGGTATVRRKWKGNTYYMDSCFNLIDKYSVRGRKIKVHGFGRTSMAMMFGWPFYSVDSSTWAKAGAFGAILIPSDKGLKSFSVSLRRGHRSQSKTSHMLEGVTRKHVIDFIESRGFSYKLMTESKYERDTWNGWVTAHLHEWKEPFLERSGVHRRYDVLL